MVTHHLELSRPNLRDCFDRDIPPVLTIDPGDSVVYRTLDAGWGGPGEKFGGIPREIEADPEHEQGHALSGPIAVRGARPGDALAIEIVDLRPTRWGWTWAGPRPYNPRYNLDLTEEAGLGWDIGSDGWATERHTGLRLALRPFMGVMGNAPAEPGRHSTTPPRRVGGNMDCRELVAGSTVLLPVEVEGAIFSVGDGHAAQGDGEVGQTALECGMERVELRFSLREQLPLDGPEAVTPAGYVTLGFGRSLDDAAVIALRAMLRHVGSAFDLLSAEAMALCSLAVDLRVTQVVNGGTVGAHAVLPPDRVQQARR
ncbi:MAG TPA: acetamidase/formamidase family protein [Chloroflexota bacterium]|nr:acetamidase/formamidase family protein [Chloroflexota bacterium]